MCGISGQYCFYDNKPDKLLLSQMSATLYHRGPDDYGTYIDDRVGLSHRRLSIIDLSENAHQPMSNEDDTIYLIFNGEIYNYKELREELILKGHIFKSESDSEVIIHAYETWGKFCLQKFNGMWAFVIWDIKSQTMFCARDRFGIKPFYYTFNKDSFLFASEIKALLVDPTTCTMPNDEDVVQFLADGIKDHSYTTMFDHIYQLQPSHFMIVDKDDENTLLQQRYWDLEISGELKNKTYDEGKTKEVSHLFGELLYKSIKSHLQSDVPIGTCLSGGIDSTTIVKFIECQDIHNQKTFSAIFPNDEKFDEYEYIADTVSRTNIDFNMTVPTPEDLIKNIDNIVYLQDEPFGSLSIYAQYCVMRQASTKVKVVLDGQGADELIAGYIGYQYTYIMTLLSQMHYYTALKELYYNLKYNFEYYQYTKDQLYARKQHLKVLKRLPVNSINRYAPELNKVLYYELFYYNLPALLHYEDRNSMAFSVESRVPYLDLNLVKFLSVMPYNQKIKNGVTKVILRDAIEGLIPESIRNRTDKMGFVTPEEKWMRDDLRIFILELIGSKSFKSRKYWDADKVIEEYVNFLDGNVSYSNGIWRIICTELWLRVFFDRK